MYYISSCSNKVRTIDYLLLYGKKERKKTLFILNTCSHNLKKMSMAFKKVNVLTYP